MNQNLVALPIAQETYAELVKGVPDLPLPKLGYPMGSEVGPDGELEYHALWLDIGYVPLIAMLHQYMTLGGYYSAMWPEMVTNEYNAAKSGHKPASQWGLPEGIQWIEVPTTGT